MHGPFAVRAALGDPRLALVHQFERRIDGVADLALGRGADIVTGLEGVVDGGFERRRGHLDSLEKKRLENGLGVFGSCGRRVKVWSRSPLPRLPSARRSGQKRGETVGDMIDEG